MSMISAGRMIEVMLGDGMPDDGKKLGSI